MDQLVCTQDFEKVASTILAKSHWDYFQSGADDEITMKENRKAFKRWLIRPRVLRDVSSRSSSTFVLGKPMAIAFGVCPMAFQKLAHLNGEIGVAKVAAQLGSIYVLSTASNCSIEEVAEATPGSRKWFQLYVINDKESSVSLIRRAEKSGYEALVLTVDLVVDGKRRWNIRNKFVLPTHLSLANFTLEETTKERESVHGSQFKDHVSDNMNASLTWQDLAWFKSVTNLPIIVKGIMTSEDAALAIEHGANGIYVSNHGGRQLDTVSSTIDVLPEIVREVGGKCEIYLDSGVMGGSDIFKALALGATAVFIGRPIIWGLIVNGENGVRTVMELLKDELDFTMALAGISSVKEITSNYVCKRPSS